MTLPTRGPQRAEGGRSDPLPSTDTVWVGALQGKHDGPISQMDTDRPGQGRAEVRGPDGGREAGHGVPAPVLPADFLSSLREVMGPSPHQARPGALCGLFGGGFLSFY